MQKMNVFISSVQKEFEKERLALYQHFRTDAFLNNFYEPVIFEKLPAKWQAPGKVYIEEVDRAQLYVILLGKEYGYENEDGISPTELEYIRATEQHIDTLVFIKGADTDNRHPKEEALLEKIKNHLSYKCFSTTEQLLQEINRSCISLLKHKGLIQLTSFDESPNPRATLADIDQDKVNTFVGVAREKRGFPLRIGTPVKKVLSHLNMLFRDQLTNSALLEFAVNPQRFFPAAIVKCAHFHGFQMEKPIPDYKIIAGDIFEQVDQTVDFILSKISLSVGLRSESNIAPLKYEIPRAVVAEAVVNAVAHRDYNSRGSVQVMLFADRLEISNPGQLTPELTIDLLKKDHASYPTNPLLAEPLYQAGYIERFGTGTGDIFRLTAEAGLKEPTFDFEESFKIIIWRPAAAGRKKSPITDHVTDHVTELVAKLLLILTGEMSRQELMHKLALSHRPSFFKNYLQPSMDAGYIEMTLPDKPRSIRQKYRITPKGLSIKQKLEDSDD